MPFRVKKVSPESIKIFYICSSGGNLFLHTDGAAVFPTREEAEAAIKKFGPEEQHKYAPFQIEEVQAPPAP